MGLDTVEIVMSWEDSFGIRIENSKAAQIVSVQDALYKAGAAADRKIRLQDSLLDFRRFETKSGFLLKFDRAIGIEGFKTHYNFLFGPTTVKDVAEKILCTSIKSLKQEDEPWSRSVVRYGVRAVIAEISGLHDFLDSDRFIEELRLD